MKSEKTNRLINKLIQIHIDDCFEDNNMNINLISDVECKLNRCMITSRFPDIYDCLQCEYIDRASLSDHAINLLLIHLEANRYKTKIWEKIRNVETHLKLIKSEREGF